MKKRVFSAGIVFLVLVIALSGCSSKEESSTKEEAKSLTKVRIGWQIPWSIQGQLVQVLKNTDILEENGLEADFVGRTFGPELNEAALAGDLDVVLTADQPAAALFSKNKGWLGIGRLMYNRTATYVPADSPIEEMEDLKGKTIGTPVGAAAQRVTAEALVDANLDPENDVNIVNLAMPEQAPLVSSGKGQTKWGNFDALSGFDPAPAIFQDQGLIKTIHEGKVVALILMNQSLIDANEEVAEKLLQSFIDAYDYYRQNVEKANDWFTEEAELKNANSDVYEIASKFEPNLKAKTKADISISFNENDFEIMQKGADFMESSLNAKIDMKKFVTNDYVNKLK